MNIKRLIPAIIITFIFIFGFEWVLHGVLLKGIYESTASLWRAPETMPQYMPWMMTGQFLFALFFCILFSYRYENRGVMEGLRFGILVGLVYAPANLIWYAVQPLPGQLIAYWIVGGLLEMALAGALVAAVYRSKVA